MLEWLAENKGWLFSGLGIAVPGSLWWLIKYGYTRWKERRSIGAATGLSVIGQPVQYEKVRRKGIADRLPSFLVRAFLKPENVAAKIRIELRGDTPIDLGLNTEVPHIDVYFEIANFSPFDLVLDRMLVEVWFGQPTFTSALYRRYLVPSGEITKNIYFRHELNSAQQNQISNYVNSDQGRGSIHIYLTAYFESSVGRVEVKHNIERRTL